MLGGSALVCRFLSFFFVAVLDGLGTAVKCVVWETVLSLVAAKGNQVDCCSVVIFTPHGCFFPLRLADVISLFLSATISVAAYDGSSI